MSENLPHHDEQWDDLPLPNEEEAWQKMQLLLEQKDKRRRLPFWFWQFTLLGILVGGMATGGYFFLLKKGRSQQKLLPQMPLFRRRKMTSNNQRNGSLKKIMFRCIRIKAQLRQTILRVRKQVSHL